MTITRRALLTSAAAVAASTVLPPIAAMPAPAAIGVDMAASSDLVAFAVGTPGEFDWISVFARTPEEAWQEWVHQHWFEDEEAAFNPEFVNRVAAWDGLSVVKPADWFRAGFGHVCDRCGYETHEEEGARAIGDEAVCEQCLTFGDRMRCDDDVAMDDLVDRIIDDGVHETRVWLENKGWWDVVGDERWAKAVAMAEAG